MASETLTLTNTEWARVEQQDASGSVLQAANFVGAVTLFLVDGTNGAVAQGVDKEGVATIGRFKTAASIDSLVVKCKLTNPTQPAGISTSSPSAAAQQPTPQNQAAQPAAGPEMAAGKK